MLGQSLHLHTILHYSQCPKDQIVYRLRINLHRIRNSRILGNSLEKLSKRQREAISLKYFHNMDTDQISSAMKINPQSVYNLIFGALKSLKTNLETELVYYY